MGEAQPSRLRCSPILSNRTSMMHYYPHEQQWHKRTPGRLRGALAARDGGPPPSCSQNTGRTHSPLALLKPRSGFTRNTRSHSQSRSTRSQFWISGAGRSCVTQLPRTDSKDGKAGHAATRQRGHVGCCTSASAGHAPPTPPHHCPASAIVGEHCSTRPNPTRLLLPHVAGQLVLPGAGGGALCI